MGCFVAIFGSRTPYGDEWTWLGQVTGDEPITLRWLWSPLNEHRMVLPRLLYLGLSFLGGGHFLAGTIFNIAILGGLSAALMRTARRLRAAPASATFFFRWFCCIGGKPII